MSILAAIVLGIVQGISEFLPISSSGHLAALQIFFGVKNPGDENLLFEVLLHLATLVSVCIVYRRDIKEMILEAIGFVRDIRHPRPEEGGPKPARRLVLMLIIATLPIFIVLPFNSLVDKLYSNTYFIGAAFLFTGLMLFLSDRMQNGRRTEKNMTVTNALTIGLCQAVAVLPGVSRSGSTITAGMAVGLNRSFAVKFSFLLSLPAIIGANILTLFKAFETGIDVKLIPIYLIGMVVAGVVGYFAIGLVRFLSQKGKFGKFSYYCFAAGILTLVLSFIM